MKKPKIFHQPEKSSHCGASCAATALDWFGEEPDPIPTLYKQIRGEGYHSGSDGLHTTAIQSYFQRKDWTAILAQSGGPFELDPDSPYGIRSHSKPHQILATWRNVHQMLKDGYLCMLEYNTAAGTNHFAVVYDAFIRRNIYWFKIACSAQGYMEVQVESFLLKTGTTQLFVKPHNNEYR